MPSTQNNNYLHLQDKVMYIRYCFRELISSSGFHLTFYVRSTNISYIFNISRNFHYLI